MMYHEPFTRWVARLLAAWAGVLVLVLASGVNAEPQEEWGTGAAGSAEGEEGKGTDEGWEAKPKEDADDKADESAAEDDTNGEGAEGEGEAAEGEGDDAGYVSNDASSFESNDASSFESNEDIAEESGGAEAQTFLEKTGLTFDLNGHLRGDIWGGKMPDYSRGEIKSGFGELALKLKVSKTPYGAAYGDIRFRAGYMNDHYLGMPSDKPATANDNYEFLTQVQLREAYVDVYAGPLDLRLGQQIIVWGRADGINPTNNLNPFDLRIRSPEEDDRRLGNVGLLAKLNFNHIRLEGVWMPIYSPSYYPEIGLPKSVRFSRPDYPSLDIANGIYAARFHLLFSAFEMSFSYLYGYSPQPGLAYVGSNVSYGPYDDDDDEDTPDVERNPNFDASQPETITVARKAYQHHVAGFDFSTTVKDYFSLRGEIAYKHPIREMENRWEEATLGEGSEHVEVHLPDPELFYVFGIDKEFGPVRLIAQYYGKYVFNPEPMPPELHEEIGLSDPIEIDLDDLSGSLDDVRESLRDHFIEYAANRELLTINRLIHNQKYPVQHGVFGRFEWLTLHETLSVSLTGMINVSTLEWMLYPKLTYSITDAMTLSVGGEIYMGPKDTLFDYIEEVLSAGYTELKIAF